MQAAACGVKTAGDNTVRTRTTSSESNVGMLALKRCMAPYHSITNDSRRRRSHLATTATISGAPRHIKNAAAEINCPALGTETFRELLMSLSVPGTTMTPVPMTKFPKSSAHKTGGMASVAAGAGLLNVGPAARPD